MSGISVHPNASYSRAPNSSKKMAKYKNNNIEGFATGNIFNSVLVLPGPNIPKSTSAPGRHSGITNTKSGTCPSTTPTIPTTTTTTATSVASVPKPPSPAFLAQIIRDEKATVESLLRTASKVGPMANTIVENESSSDAAFISKAPSPIPTYGSTLQGFTFILFFWSFVSFSIVIAIYINQTTGNTANAVGTFVACIALMLIIFALMKRYA